MTREEAIEQLEWYFEEDNGISADLVTKQAFNTIKKALSQEPCRYWQNGKCNGNTEVCDDAISREAVQKEINCWIGSGEYRYAMSERFLIDRINDLPSVTQKPIECDDAISRKEALNCINDTWGDYFILNELFERISKLPPVTPKSGHCKECKYFEYDSVAKVDGIPLIVAHEICNKWGNGCKTSEDGYCYLFEPQESESDA